MPAVLAKVNSPRSFFWCQYSLLISLTYLGIAISWVARIRLEVGHWRELSRVTPPASVVRYTAHAVRR
jgi:hypothetical protein